MLMFLLKSFVVGWITILILSTIFFIYDKMEKYIRNEALSHIIHLCPIAIVLGALILLMMK